MFKFIKCQYDLGKITKEQVLSFYPKWITQEELNNILEKEGDNHI